MRKVAAVDIAEELYYSNIDDLTEFANLSLDAVTFKRKSCVYNLKGEDVKIIFPKNKTEAIELAKTVINWENYTDFCPDSYSDFSSDKREIDEGFESIRALQDKYDDLSDDSLAYIRESRETFANNILNRPFKIIDKRNKGIIFSLQHTGLESHETKTAIIKRHK